VHDEHGDRGAIGRDLLGVLGVALFVDGVSGVGQARADPGAQQRGVLAGKS
jgi:hypothetical protein